MHRKNFRNVGDISNPAIDKEEDMIVFFIRIIESKLGKEEEGALGFDQGF